MTTLVTSPFAAILQNPADAEAQLAADIRAITSGSDRAADADALVSRPSILRRLAVRIAETLAPEVDRIVSAAGPDAQLATAISVHSGRAMAVIDAAGRVHGELHPAERVAVVSVFAEPQNAGVCDQVEAVGALVLAVCVAVDEALLAGQCTRAAGAVRS